MNRYKSALAKISARTGVPLASLVLSFGILHEITAVAPLVGFFYGARAVGAGEQVIEAAVTAESPWVRDKCQKWVEEGEGWAERVGKRYGVFGFEKGEEPAKHHLAGQVANAVVAYGLTKVIAHILINAQLSHRICSRHCFPLE